MTDEERIAMQEAYWTGPRLFALGLGFLACAIGLIYVLACV